MKKVIMIILLFLFISSFISCQLVVSLFDENQIIQYNILNQKFNINYNLTYLDKGCKISSIQINDILLISYIDPVNGNIYFKYLKLDQKSIYNEDNLYNLADENDIPLSFSTGFNFQSSSHPYVYIPYMRKITDNIIALYYIDSNYYLHEEDIKLIYDYSKKRYTYQIVSSNFSVNPVESALLSKSTGKLYNLKKSDKIGYVTFYNNLFYVVTWDKNNIFNMNKINFSISGYNLYEELNSNIIEYNLDKIIIANIADEYATNYLILNYVDLFTRESGLLYDSKIEGKTTYNSNIKMLYIEEQNKLYLAWSYSKDGKNYVAISELDFTNKKLIDRFKIDITGKNMEDIDLRRTFKNSSNIFLVYSTNTTDSTNEFVALVINTYNFDNSNWSSNQIYKNQVSNSLIYNNIFDLDYCIIGQSIYNDSNELDYQLYLFLDN